MGNEDMFETMDRILGETERDLKKVTDKSNTIEVGFSKPSHPLWKLIDQWGGQLYLSADQLELWEGEP